MSDAGIMSRLWLQQQGFTSGRINTSVAKMRGSPIASIR